MADCWFIAFYIGRLIMMHGCNFQKKDIDDDVMTYGRTHISRCGCNGMDGLLLVYLTIYGMDGAII